jgi:hypothetical protein
MTATTGPGHFSAAAFAETDWLFGVQWKPVVAAALAGFAVTLILATLGMAIGMTAGASTDAPGEAIGAGALIWWAITVIVAGLAAGRVLAITSRRDIHYHPMIFGTLAWVLGVIILLFLLANGVGNVIGGLGGGMGAAAGSAGMTGGMSPADSARALRTAADVGQGAAWGLLLSQLLGLGATILGAGRRDRTTVTERPAVGTVSAVHR